MSVGITIEDDGSIGLAIAQLNKLATPDLRKMLGEIGAEVEDQTKARLSRKTGKKAPDGSPWKSWSKAYAGSKHGVKDHEPHPGARRVSGEHTILWLTSDLHRSIKWQLSGDDVLIGSTIEYGPTQNEERPFLGLSAKNSDDIEKLVVDMMGELLP